MFGWQACWDMERRWEWVSESVSECVWEWVCVCVCVCECVSVCVCVCVCVCVWECVCECVWVWVWVCVSVCVCVCVCECVCVCVWCIRLRGSEMGGMCVRLRIISWSSCPWQCRVTAESAPLCGWACYHWWVWFFCRWCQSLWWCPPKGPACVRRAASPRSRSWSTSPPSSGWCIRRCSSGSRARSAAGLGIWGSGWRWCPARWPTRSCSSTAGPPSLPHASRVETPVRRNKTWAMTGQAVSKRSAGTSNLFEPALIKFIIIQSFCRFYEGKFKNI